MKTLLTAIVISCGALFPVHHAEAAPASKRFGGFASGQTFTLKIKSIISTRAEGIKIVKNAPIAKPIPNFKKGTKVKFTIGPKGQLKGPGFNITFIPSPATSAPNDYSNTSKDPFKLTSVGKVEKNSKLKPTRAILSFHINKLSGSTLSIHDVLYTLE